MTKWSKSIPVALWPKLDREAWEAALRPSDDIFDARGPASRWSPATRRKTQLGYGRFLFFLDQRGELDPDSFPAARVTRARDPLMEGSPAPCREGMHLQQGDVILAGWKPPIASFAKRTGRSRSRGRSPERSPSSAVTLRQKLRRDPTSRT
jgi:hypothetical protein